MFRPDSDVLSGAFMLKAVRASRADPCITMRACTASPYSCFVLRRERRLVVAARRTRSCSQQARNLDEARQLSPPLAAGGIRVGVVRPHGFQAPPPAQAGAQATTSTMPAADKKPVHRGSSSGISHHDKPFVGCCLCGRPYFIWRFNVSFGFQANSSRLVLSSCRIRERCSWGKGTIEDRRHRSVFWPNGGCDYPDRDPDRI